MKTKRNLSGIFIRADKENRVFEDLSEEQQDAWLATLDNEALKRLAKTLGGALNEIGDYFDLEK